MGGTDVGQAVGLGIEGIEAQNEPGSKGEVRTERRATGRACSAGSGCSVFLKKKKKKRRTTPLAHTPFTRRRRTRQNPEPQNGRNSVLLVAPPKPACFAASFLLRERRFRIYSLCAPLGPAFTSLCRGPSFCAPQHGPGISVLLVSSAGESRNIQVFGSGFRYGRRNTQHLADGLLDKNAKGHACFLFVFCPYFVVGHKKGRPKGRPNRTAFGFRQLEQKLQYVVYCVHRASSYYYVKYVVHLSKNPVQVVDCVIPNHGMGDYYAKKYCAKCAGPVG